jgi:hypothetical protein
VRYLATATMAASVLAIGLKIDPAVSLPLGGNVTGADNAIQQVQQQEKGEKGMGQGQAPGGGPAAGGGGKQGGPAAREPGGGGGGAMRGKREGGGMREGGGGAQFRSGERGARGEGSAQLRSERGLRENGGTRFRAERRTRGDRGVEFGYRERGDRGRTGVYIDRDRDRRHSSRRGGVYIEPSYGYAPASCNWLRRRALATDSAYWWRRYRACRGL